MQRQAGRNRVLLGGMLLFIFVAVVSHRMGDFSAKSLLNAERQAVDQNVLVVGSPQRDALAPVYASLDSPFAPPRQKRIRVCAVALNPRQGSLFRTNRIGLAGSGKYVYFTKAQW